MLTDARNLKLTLKSEGIYLEYLWERVWPRTGPRPPVYLPHFCLSFRAAHFACGKRLWHVQIWLAHSAKQVSRAVSITASSGEFSWPHCLTISAVSACVSQCCACCLKTKRGNFTKCLSCHRAQCSPSPPRREQPGTPVPAHLQGTWFLAPNHCLTRFQGSHSCATHFHLCRLSQTLYIPMHRVSGAPGCLQGGEPPACPSKKLYPSQAEPWPAVHPWTTSAKHSATICAVFSLDQLAANPCLVLPFLCIMWNMHFKEASLAFCWGKESEHCGRPALGQKDAEDLSTASGVISPQKASDQKQPCLCLSQKVNTAHSPLLFIQSAPVPQTTSSYPVIPVTTFPPHLQFFTPLPSLPSRFCF